MIATSQQHAILPSHWPVVAVAGLFAVALAGWVGLHVASRRVTSAKLRPVMFALRVAAGFATILLAGQLAARGMLLTTNWRVWPLALGGALAVEVLLSLYALERRTVSRRAGMALAGMRVALVLLVVAMLAQPVLSWVRVEEIQRYVAVLVDGSASMRVTDPQRTASEKLRLAEMLSIGTAKRRVRLEQTGKELQSLRSGLVAAGEDLAMLAAADARTRQKQLEARRGELHKALQAAEKSAARQGEDLALALDGLVKLEEPLRSGLRDAKAILAVGVRDRLAKAQALTARESAPRLGENYEPLRALLHGTTADLAKLTAQIDPLSQAYDEAVFATLSAAQRQEISAATGKTRLELAWDVLLARRPAADGKGPAAPSLLDRLGENYKVRVYEFAADCVECDPLLLRAAAEERSAAARAAAAAPATAPSTMPATAPAAGASPFSLAAATQPAAGPTTRPVGEQATDLAKALATVAGEMSGKQLAGVVMLGDGRHNAPGRVEPLATQLGLQKVPVCSVVMAPSAPPRDAAVIAVHAAQTVTEQDKFVVEAVLKLDGLGGQNVDVALYDAKRQVASHTVHVPKDAASFRSRVQFSDEPKGIGLHAYSVRIAHQPGEVFPENNDYPMTVSVTRERVNLLVIEDRPRWEFRYLKNLFADRDRNVKLQYVLLHPDRVEGQAERAKVAASASRPDGQAEATLLPASPADWMKFDAIVLGDVPPSTFAAGQMEALRRFVTDRGGTLIIIAGANFMPHAYAGTGLAEVLPVTFQASQRPVAGDQKAGYRIALTPAGAGHTVMFQKVEPEENLQVWSAVPDIFWRHPTTVAKEGTTVLAYAMPASPPDFLRPPPATAAADDSLARQREAQQRRFQQDNALIVVHNAAAGRVMMLNFDQTWRLRYRVGDTYHHRFWGQVMRWATADKLRAGTDFVKLGTDQVRYGPGKPVRVRAKIVQPDLTPVVSENVGVTIYAADKPVLRRHLDYQPGSPGIYEARVESLPSGQYRVELDAPEAEPILAADRVRKVLTEFSVDPQASAEEVELSADRGLLQRVASLSGGVMLDPHQAAEVLQSLGPPSLVHRQQKELRLWDSWPLLVIFVALLTAEWVLRKRVGLA